MVSVVRITRRPSSKISQTLHTAGKGGVVGADITVARPRCGRMLVGHRPHGGSCYLDQWDHTCETRHTVHRGSKR